MRNLVSIAALAAVGLAAEGEADRSYRSSRPSWMQPPRQDKIWGNQAPQRRSYAPKPRPEPRPEPVTYRPAPQPKPAPKPKVLSGVIHQKPWEQCQASIADLQSALQKKQDRDTDLAPAIGAFGISFMSEMINVDSGLTQVAEANASDIALIVEQNGEQDTAIMDIMTEAAALSTTATEQQAACQEADFLLSKINPTTIEALMMRLADIEEKQMTLMGEVAAFDDTYEDDLATANTAIDAVVDDVLPDLVTAAMDNEAAVAELEESIVAEAANANGNKTLAEAVEADLAKLVIFDEYYFIMDVTNVDIGDQELMTQEADNLLPFSCFEIDTTTAEYNAVLEFFFSATINSSPEGVKATKVSLRKDGVVVAVAVAEEDDEGGPLASNFSIFYKELVPAMSVFAFDIQVFQSGPEDPMAASPTNIMWNDSNGNNLGLMWGYKLQSTELTTLDTAPSCPPPM